MMLMWALVAQGAVLVVVCFTFVWQIEQIRKSHHQERMDLLLLIKAQSLAEYTAAGQPQRQQSPSTNFIRSAMQNAARQDDER